MRVLECAFQAHHRTEYELSIPVFLAQADGVCQEVTGYKLYGRKQKKPITAGFAANFVYEFLIEAVLEPLRTPLPISASLNDEDYRVGTLNRHEVLHGISVDYGTRTNSLKAMSLLSYVCSIPIISGSVILAQTSD